LDEKNKLNKSSNQNKETFFQKYKYYIYVGIGILIIFIFIKLNSGDDDGGNILTDWISYGDQYKI
jgi:hypothetical protein